jgi:protein-disulfide isomerase/peroxiredoxin
MVMKNGPRTAREGSGAWWIALLGAVVVLGAVMAWRRVPAPKGERAPDVAVELLDGRVMSLSELEGRVVLVNFWATWCPPCRLEMPGFQRVYEARSDDGFDIVGLSTDVVSDEQIRWFLEQQGIGYPVGRASRYASESYGGPRGVQTLPTSFLVDAEGRIRRTVTGVYEEEALLADVDGLLREAGLEPTGEVARPSRLAPTFLDVEGAGHPLGEADAPITVVEFSDYGCAYCGQFAQQTFPELYREFIQPGRVRWVHVPFILGKFQNSLEATRAAACAAEQGESTYWAVHLGLFRRQPEWRVAADPLPVFRRYLDDAGADVEAFTACYRENRPADALREADRIGLAAGVGATPTFFVNGRRVEGAMPLAQFREALRSVEAGG